MASNKHGKYMSQNQLHDFLENLRKTRPSTSVKPARPLSTDKQDRDDINRSMNELRLNELPSMHISQDEPMKQIGNGRLRHNQFTKVDYGPPLPPMVPDKQHTQPHHRNETSRRAKIELPTGLSCTGCSDPISGRVLSAGILPYHPTCFVCHHCQTPLEHVSFFLHEDRLFCHLDYHELFSPRCKSCATPIEGEVISALGATYHVGHFFCAGCGDPFDSATPFVEKGNYAWCTTCHTNRHLPRCAACKKPLVDTVVNVLGKEWHQQCFKCSSCHEILVGGFFVDKEKDLAMCQSCEEKRLKE